MKCKLMHKNIPVMSVEFDEITGVFTGVHEVITPEHIPVGIMMANGVINRKELHDWWFARAIPASRSGLKEALEKLNISTTAQMLGKSYGLNLSDQYWLCPGDLAIDWSSVNFFDNEFSEDIGNILIGIGSDSEQVNYMSPDSASDGWLKKKWKIVDGERVLFKAGSGTLLQEPYNEIIATAIMKRLDIPCVEYSLALIGDKPYSACKDFIDSHTELVTAHNILKANKKPNNKSVYEHYINCCKELGVSDIELRVNQMLTLDYIIVNADRHQNNFGLIRNADTLEYISAAPIYDSGSSLWFNIPSHDIKAGAMNVESKPFKKSHADQIKLVKDFSWLEFDKLKGIDEECYEILKKADTIDSQRRDTLCKMLNLRIDMLKQIAEHTIKHTEIRETGEDIVEDIAYSGEDEGITML